MAKSPNLITCEIHPPEQDLGDSDSRQTDKTLVDFFLLLHEWNEKAKKEDAKIQ